MVVPPELVKLVPFPNFSDGVPAFCPHVILQKSDTRVFSLDFKL